MSIEWQDAFNLLVLVCGAMGGWILKTVWAAIKEMQASDKELAEKVAAVEVLVAGQYVTKAELNGSMERIERVLTRIEDKLDGKADKR